MTIEAYWAEPEVIAGYFDLSMQDANALLDEAVEAACEGDEALKERRSKRVDAIRKLSAQGELPQYGDGEVEAEAMMNGEQHKVLGKSLISKIRGAAQKKGYAKASSFGKSIPGDLERPLADDLEALLKQTL